MAPRCSAVVAKTQAGLQSEEALPPSQQAFVPRPDVNEIIREDDVKAQGAARQASDKAAPQVHVARSGNFNRPSGPRGVPELLRDRAEFKRARNTELYMMHTVGFELDKGDTLVFVHLPSIPKDPRKQADCDGIAFRPQEFRVHSERLLATGSAKFAEMLRPTYQFRIRRRRKMAHSLPHGVQYLLDLTPPAEGDELVFQMTELSLTPGIMKWWSSYKFHDVDPSLVTGHDDVCTCKRQAPRFLEEDSDEGFGGWQENAGNMSSPDVADGILRSSQETEKSNLTPPTPGKLLEMKMKGDDYGIYKTPPFRQIPDYCPVRHCNAIIRLLILVEGRHVLLDSASRVWTMVAVAKIFDCASVVRDQVMQWMMHGTNTRFMEVLPEEALRIGVALENAQVTQCAFRILVNELALMEAAGTDDAQRQGTRRTTVFGRRLGECGDELNNVIQHAARALVERVSATKAQLQSPALFDYWAIAEWAKLRRLEGLLTWRARFQKALAKLQRLMQLLPEAIASKFDEAAQEPFLDKSEMLSSMDMDRATYVLPDDFEKLSDILPGLNVTQKLLCPFIYDDLGDRCSLPLYPGTGFVVEPLGGRLRCSLLREVEEALQQAVGDKAATGCTDEWVEFLEAVKGGSESEVPMVKLPLMDLDRMDSEVKDALRPLTLSWIRHDVDPPLNLTRHMLLTLTMNEMKFLPLWAGGFDDGTGGVFERFVPPTDMGPDGPGPAYHTGSTLPSAPRSMSDSMTEAMSAMRVEGSTTAASMDVHDSISTVYRPDRVIADDASIMSEAFTTNGADDYQEAKCAVPAEQHGEDGTASLMDGGWKTDGEDGRWAATDVDSVVVDGLELDEDEAHMPFSETSDSDDGSVVVV